MTTRKTNIHCSLLCFYLFFVVIMVSWCQTFSFKNQSIKWYIKTIKAPNLSSNTQKCIKCKLFSLFKFKVNTLHFYHNVFYCFLFPASLLIGLLLWKNSFLRDFQHAITSTTPKDNKFFFSRIVLFLLVFFCFPHLLTFSFFRWNYVWFCEHSFIACWFPWITIVFAVLS